MERNNKNSFISHIGRVFSLKYFPLDLAKILTSPMLLYFRSKRIDAKGNKYRRHLKGSAVLAPNHMGFSDPVSIVACFWYRRVFSLTSEVTMGGRLRSALLSGVGCIKIDRNISDIEAIHKVRGVLSKGKLLVVFPQGRINRESSSISGIKSGAVLMALQAGAPIIPIYSEKQKSIFERRVFVIGDQICPSDHIKGRFPSMAEIDKVTGILEDSMKHLRETYLKVKGLEL